MGIEVEDKDENRKKEGAASYSSCVGNRRREEYAYKTNCVLKFEREKRIVATCGVITMVVRLTV